MSADDTERRRRLLAIFDEVLDLDPADRAGRLDVLCGGDAGLRARVEALLAADAADAEPFAGDAARWAEALTPPADAATPACDEDGGMPAGETVGAWRIAGLLGRGGMGAVYAVERADGAYAQKAALKRVRGGELTPASRERFLRERQVLARLQHPHIATLLDGGFDAQGDPYFVMERVDGVPIDRWCDERRLGLRERVVLFLQALEAVQYAHRNLVVHRDLKPSNLLVTPEGQVKLLDFGIARELEQAGLAATATGDRAMTLQYASPEQLHNEPVTTATDVYQLGVVLYRLLAGRHPFGIEADTPLARQLQALSGDPEPITHSARQSDAEVASRRGESPASLARALDGSLEAIVHACLRRDPAARYASAEALSADLRAWLDDRPVSAARLGKARRARLWLRRNRALAVSAAAVLAALLAGTGVALWQAREAREQASIAQRESAGARAALQFLTDTLAAAAPGQAMSTEVSVRQLLDKARAQLDERGTDDPQVKQAIQRLLGHLYYSLGEPKQALALFEAGLDGVEAQGRDEALSLAADVDGYANALAMQERSKDSLAAAERAAALRERFAPGDPLQQLLSHKQIGNAHLVAFDLAKADEHWTQVLAIAGTMADPPVDKVIEVYAGMGNVLVDLKGESQRALELMDEGLAFADAHGVPAQSPLRINMLRHKAMALSNVGDSVAAESLLRDVIDTQARTVGSGGQMMGELHSTLGNVLNKLGRYREAQAELMHAYDLGASARGTPMVEATGLANLGQTHAYAGDYPQSLALFEQAVAKLDEAGLDADNALRRQILRNRTQALVMSGRLREAGELLHDLRARALRLEGEDSLEYTGLTGYLAMLAWRAHDPGAGQAHLQEARTRWAKRVPETHPVFTQLLRYEAAFALWQSDPDTAERRQREALQRLEAGTNRTDVAVARAELAGIRDARGDPAEARRLLAEALPVLREAVQAQHVGRADAEALAQRLRM